MSSSPPRTRVRAARIDQVCAEAVDLARSAVIEAVPEAPDSVGGHLGLVAEDERLVTHYFECLLPGYRGWRWAATVTRVPRSKHVTVDETTLLPGPGALLAPEWVPWHERLEPGDLGVGDLLPTAPDDDRLEPGYLLSDDPALEGVAWELGLGRPRVLSRIGRAEAAERWYEGDRGPTAPIARSAPPEARCATCGFSVPVAGALRQLFAVCTNAFAPDDGMVVSLDHGCGAHSELMVESLTPVEEMSTVYDDAAVESVAEPVAEAEAVPAPEAEPSAAESPAAEQAPPDGTA